MKILYITPHLSTGGAPQYLLKKIQYLHEDNDIYVVEYNDYGSYRVQKDQILKILGDNLFTLSDNKFDILKYLDNIKPDIIHFEEMPEFFMDDHISHKIYDKTRNYLIFETSHDSSFEPTLKRFLPDKFLFCSDNQLQKFRKLDIPACVVEYPVEEKTKEKIREIALRELGVDPAFKHVLNVGLWTSRKNQAEIIEYAKQFNDIQFHFVGNQAENFKDYWEPLMKDLPDNCTVWGERNDVDRFYSCMDLFLFTSKGNPGDKETNPLVLKEALSWNIPILAHKLDSYLNKLDDQVTWLSDDFNINLLKISRFLGISDRKIKCWIEDTKIDFDFLDSYESLVNKLICVYESDNDLLVYRTKVQAGAMWVQPHCVKRFINGLRVRIYDVPGDYFSNLSDEDLLTEHNILFEKNFYLKKQPDVKIQGQKRKFYGIKDDASSWYTFYETLHKEYYKDLQLKEGDSVIDIGGHYGFFDLYALNQKVSHIHTIEPTKTSFDILSKNLSGFKNIKKHNLAISCLLYTSPSPRERG